VSSILFVWLIRLYQSGLADFPGADSLRVVEAFTYKPNVGPGRLLAFAIVATFAISLVSTLWRPLVRATGWLLLPLGQHALFAYACHLLVLGLTWKVGVALYGYAPSADENVALQAVGVAIVLGEIALKQRLFARMPHLPWPRLRSMASVRAR
jgi:hypothetical protein